MPPLFNCCFISFFKNIFCMAKTLSLSLWARSVFYISMRVRWCLASTLLASLPHKNILFHLYGKHWANCECKNFVIEVEFAMVSCRTFCIAKSHMCFWEHETNSMKTMNVCKKYVQTVGTICLRINTHGQECPYSM